MEALIVLGIIALIVLFFFIIQTLFYLQHSLKKLDSVLSETENKLKKLNPLFNTLENAGDLVEKESIRLKNEYTYKHLNEFNNKRDDSSEELASLLASGIILGIKFLKRR